MKHTLKTFSDDAVYQRVQDCVQFDERPHTAKWEI
jgi:hypothetical protein